MNYYLKITCEKHAGKFFSTVERDCDATQLGEGLKDICLYLKQKKIDFEGNIELENGSLLVEWKETIGGRDYSLLTDTEMVDRMNAICAALHPSLEIDDKLIFHDYMLDEVNDKVNEMILSIEKNGKMVTMKKYKSEMDFIFRTIGFKVIPMNDVTFTQSGFSFNNILSAMQSVYHGISHSEKKYFHYFIDFEELDIEEYIK